MLSPAKSGSVWFVGKVSVYVLGSRWQSSPCECKRAASSDPGCFYRHSFRFGCLAAACVIQSTVFTCGDSLKISVLKESGARGHFQHASLDIISNSLAFVFWDCLLKSNLWCRLTVSFLRGRSDFYLHFINK